MSTKRIAYSTIFGNAGNSRIPCRGINAMGVIPFTLGFLFTLGGIGVLPAAYAQPMPAPLCPEKGNESNPPGGEASWEKCTKEGITHVSVWVTDTAYDNKCAQAVINFYNGVSPKSDPVCDGAPTANFKFEQRADGADVKLQLKAR